MSAGLVPSGRSEGESVHVSVLASGDFQQSLAFLAHRCITPVSASVVTWSSSLSINRM